MSASSGIQLSPPSRGRVDLLIVAGEHSGDEHASRMLRGLLHGQPNLSVCALGGPKLAAAGAQLLYDLTAQSSIGFEVLKKISFYRALIAEVVRWVGEHRPRAVCFVDSSGLNLRIAKGLFERGFSAKAGGPTKTLYYISPQIWASRAGRRFKMAAHLDALAAIFPFEPDRYADTSLPVTFVGHPFVAPDYAPPVRFDANGPVMLLPGSRRQAVGRIFPVFLAAYAKTHAEIRRRAVVLYPSDGIRAELERVLAQDEFADVRGGVELRHVGEGGPDTAAIGASAVLTSSGTMSMHCALAGIPGAVAYRTDGLTYFLGRFLVKVPYLGIANLLLNEPMYPEFIQHAATPEVLAAELRSCVNDPKRRERTAADAQRLHAMLAHTGGQSASEWLARQLA